VKFTPDQGDDWTVELTVTDDDAAEDTAGDTITVRTRDHGTFDMRLEAAGRTAGNVTFQPAPVDRILPRLEQQFPGTIAFYEQYNDWLVGDCPGGRQQGVCSVTATQLELARWEWIRDEYPALKERAEQRIAEREPQIDQPAPAGVMGILIPRRHAMDVEYGLDPLLPVVDVLYMLLYYVALINLAIGTANLLPVKGLDGGWMLSILLEEFVPEKEPRITRAVTITTLLLIGISFAFFLGRLFL